MKTILRVLFTLIWVAVVWAVWIADAAREARLKRQLGANYEGSEEWL